MGLFSIVAILTCTAVVTGYALRVARSGRTPFARLGPSPGSPLLPGWIVEAFYWALHAPARALVRTRVEPDTITWLSLIVSVASLPLTATGHFRAAAVVILVGATLDALDGMVARTQGRASPAGAVLDSFVDRMADAAPYFGLAVFYRNHGAILLLPLAAMLASSLVSYARAKSDAHGLALPNGLMRRHERIVYLVAALALAPVARQTVVTGPIEYPIVLAGTALIAAIGFVAAFRLVARTRAALRLAGAAGQPHAAESTRQHDKSGSPTRAPQTLL